MTQDESARWFPATRVAFRLCVIYFTLYVCTTQMLGGLIPLPIGRLPDVGGWFTGYISWIGRMLFGVAAAPVVSGSGDTLFDWVHVPAMLVLATLGTIAWSLLDRHRLAYPRLHRWFRVFLRFALGSTMLTYGIVKVIPLQMGAPMLTRLLEPYGHFSPMGVLWSSIGASFSYERFVGSVELACAVLLFIPRTATLGAALSVAAATQVFVLNMTYDVPVKLFSFHLILMSLFLLAPDAGRLLAAVLAHGARRRWAAVAQVAFGLYLVGFAWYGARQSWHGFGGGAPKPALYGIWTVDRMLIDQQLRPPLVTDMDRWRHVVIQNATTIVFWRMDDNAMFYQATYDADAGSIALKRGTADAGSLAFQRPDETHLVLNGTVGGHQIYMETSRLDHTQLPLVSRGFNWIQEFPFNR
ncbi:MAG: hypothetical protein R2752_05210 [Vicinamibacterales bacterium]